MSLKGYPDQHKSTSCPPDHVTVEPVREQQHGLSTIAHTYVQQVTTDTAETGSTTTEIVATSHSARRGDIVSFTSGNLNRMEFKVWSVDTNTITVAETMPEAPANGDGFAILRHKYPVVTSGGGISVTATGSAGRSLVTSVRNDYSSDGVTTGAWVELVSSLGAEVNLLDIFDSSGQTMELGVGAAASEARVAIIYPGGNGQLPLQIASGSRVSIRAVSNDADAGELNINFLA